jgi:hypothetical protein
LATNRKVEFASRASKRGVAILRQGERRNTRKGDREEKNKRDKEAAKPTIRYCLLILDLPSDKQRRSYTTKNVMRGLVLRQVLEYTEIKSFWKKIRVDLGNKILQFDSE